MKRLILLSGATFFISAQPHGQSTANRPIAQEARRYEDSVANNMREIDSLKHEKAVNEGILRIQQERADSLANINYPDAE